MNVGNANADLIIAMTFLGFHLASLLIISALEKFASDEWLLANHFELAGSLLSFLKREHFSGKDDLNSSIFSLKSVMNLLL